MQTKTPIQKNVVFLYKTLEENVSSFTNRLKKEIPSFTNYIHVETISCFAKTSYTERELRIVQKTFKKDLLGYEPGIDGMSFSVSRRLLAHVNP